MLIHAKLNFIDKWIQMANEIGANGIWHMATSYRVGYLLKVIPNGQDLETAAHELAIDGPSAKMEQFLAKNYGIERLLRQNNNFAVAPQFFAGATEIK